MRKLTKREEMIRESTERARRKKRKFEMSLQARIDLAVSIIRCREKNQGGAYALHNKRRLFNSGRLRGSKLG